MKYQTGKKIKHIRTGVVETILGVCKIKNNGEWVDGVIYTGKDRFSDKYLIFVRTKDDFDNEFIEIE